MQEFSSCKESVRHCIETKSFSVAYLYSEEKTMDMHIHDCCEIYYSISGGRQFLIGEKCYEIEPGDVFVINQYESHYLTRIEASAHERIVISIFPNSLKGCRRKRRISRAVSVSAAGNTATGYGSTVKARNG